MPTEPGAISQFFEIAKGAGFTGVGAILTGGGLLLLTLQFNAVSKGVQRLYADVATILGELARARIELWHAKRDAARRQAEDLSLYLSLHKYNERITASLKKDTTPGQRPLDIRDSGTWPAAPIRVVSRENAEFRGVPAGEAPETSRLDNSPDGVPDRLRDKCLRTDES